MTILVTLLGVVVALLGLLVVGLLRTHAEILRSLHDLGVELDPRSTGVTTATAAPTVRRQTTAPGATRDAVDVVGVAPDGAAVSIAVSGAARLTLFAFLTGTCASCLAFWESFADDGALTIPGDARLVIVTKDDSAESLSAIRRLAPRHVPVVMSSAAWNAYDVPVAPFFVLIDGASSAVVGEGAANTWEQVSSMVAQAIADETAGARRGAYGNRAGDRADLVDAELLAAGIVPGDPRLYPGSADAIDPREGVE